MTQEQLWSGMVFTQPDSLFPLGTDSMALAGFSRFSTGSRVADLGCGSGAIALMLLASDPSLHLTGIELDPLAVEAAAENARVNQVDFQVIHGDLRTVDTFLPPGSFDGCVANPPYFPVGAGVPGARANARSEVTLSLQQLCRAAAWLLRWGGKFALVHRPERLGDVMCTLRESRLEPKRLRLVRHQASKPPSLLLLEAKKGARPGLMWEPDLTLRDAAGRETAASRALYHRDGKDCD